MENQVRRKPIFHGSMQRRDFLQGAAVGITLAGLPPELARAAAVELKAQNDPGYYPPALLGMRGDHVGSFEAAHALRDNDFWRNAHSLQDTGETYDLVIIGAGISGLAAAHFFRANNPKSNILLIENHDDFGGHAKRNEFRLGGRTELINGGTMDIDSPTPYSPTASGLLKSLGVDPIRLEEDCADPYPYAGLATGVFFDREQFGRDQLVSITLDDKDHASPESWRKFVSDAPLNRKAKSSVLKIETGNEDYFPGLTSDQKKDKLWRISYRDYLTNVVGASPLALALYQHRTDEEWGLGIDAVSALDCWGMGYPGFAGLKLQAGGPLNKRMGYTPAGYSTTGGSEFFHFPDGNASIARLLVRSLIPAAITGRTATDIVTACCHYSKLDEPNSSVRIRLNSLAVRVRNVGDGVEIAYSPSNGGQIVFRVKAKLCVMACWNMIIPWLVPELPELQKSLLRNMVKSPLVYASVALRNWRPFWELKVKRILSPGGYFSMMVLNPTVNIGEYKSPRSPSEPMLVRMVRAFARPGLSEYDQNRVGRMELLTTPFEQFEHNARDQLSRVLAGTRFDAKKDIEGIIVNRWAHGYAPEYNALWERGYDADHTPNLIARRKFGRIAIANADSGYGAFTDVAIDQAHRAVNELLHD